MGYEEFFGLKDTPFRLAPDPDYYFPSDVHKEALDTLRYSIRAGEGFIQITGEPGTGKTLLLRTLLRDMGKEVSTALVLNPSLSPQGLLRVILTDLGCDVSDSSGKEELLKAFSDFVIQKNRDGVRTVIIVDEAQDLPSDTLEELRLLSNLETEKKKLMQIILVGQLELEQKLANPTLKQLAQRITIRYRLKPLSRPETTAYIHHRLAIAGGADGLRFSSRVLTGVQDRSKGIPRVINIVCERMLMAAYVDGTKRIDRTHLKKSLQTFMTHQEFLSTMRWSRTVFPFALAALVSIILITAIHLKPRLLVGSNLAGLPSDRPQPIAAENLRIDDTQTPEASQPQAPVRPLGREQLPTASVDQEKTHTPWQKPDNISDITSPAVSSTVPFYVFRLAEKRVAATLDRDEKKLCIWEGGNSAPLLRGEYRGDDLRLAKGLYLVGNEPNKGSFVFSQSSRFMALSKAASENLWRYVSCFTSEKIVPLLVFSSKNHMEDGVLERAGGISSVLTLWANGWRRADIDLFMSSYGPVIAFYDTKSDKPTIASWSSYHTSKKARFLSDGRITLVCSDHVCLLDPNNNKMAMVLFSQRFVSSTHSDSGVKVLFLRLQGDKSRGRAWKIVGSFWMG